MGYFRAAEIGVKPAAQGPIQVVDDLSPTLSGGPLRLGTDRVFELVQAFRPRTTRAALEAVAKEVKAVFGTDAK